MQADKELQPEVIVFAGPNGSGKSTITRMVKIREAYEYLRDTDGSSHSRKTGV